MSAIADTHARQILDSRGNPTLEVDALLESGAQGRAAVLAVQWELQEEWRIDPRFLAVFDWLVDAAARFSEREPAL